MSTPVEKIKERLDIAEVIGSYLTLEKAGANFKAKCPFHNEKTPSFFISPSRQGFYCFGCGAKGDIFTFVEQFEGVDFKGALKTLALRAGIELTPERAEVKSERDRLFAVLESATQFFQGNLAKAKGPYEYLTKRGLEKMTIESWRLGFAPNEWRLLKEHLEKLGYTEKEMLGAGLIKKSEKEGKTVVYDTFRGRIMFPIFDSSGRVIAFSGRVFEGDESTAKYLNSPDGTLFNKSEVLYGFDRAKLSIRPKGYAILVEGQMDLLMAHQAGYANTVATSGTALTEGHLDRLRKLSTNLIMAYDGDDAGLNASKRGFALALQMGLNVRVAQLPKGMDPADLILSDAKQWHDALKDSKHIIDIYTDALVQKHTSPFTLGREVVKEVLPFVKKIKSAVDQANFVAKIAHKTKTREDALWQELKKIPADAEYTSNDKPREPQKANPTLFIERKAWGLIAYAESKNIPGFDASSFRKQCEEIIGTEKENIISVLEKERDALLFEAEATYGDRKGGEMTRIIKEMLINLETDRLKETYAQTMLELGRAEKDRDETKASGLLKKCHDLGARLTELEKMLVENSKV